MQVWDVLHAARWKCRTQLCRATSSQLKHVSTIGKEFLKPQCLPHMYSQYGELRPTSGWDLLASLGHPSKFQRVSRLGTVTARHLRSGRQPKFAVLNRGCHLYSAGRPSRWALAHVLVMAALCNRVAIIFLPCSFVLSSSIFLYLFSSTNLSGHRLDVYHTSTHGVALVRI